MDMINRTYRSRSRNFIPTVPPGVSTTEVRDIIKDTETVYIQIICQVSWQAGYLFLYDLFNHALSIPDSTALNFIRRMFSEQRAGEDVEGIDLRYSPRSCLEA
jgi:hypothetical protein